MTFNEFNLHQKIVDTIKNLGLVTPTPIQEQAIPLILEGKDLRASARTGTGKTAAFVLPALNLVSKGPRTGKGPRVLILTPTRELADQVASQVLRFSSALPQIKTVCVYGGTPYPVQNRQLARPYDILVATPGRLIDQLENNRIDLSEVEMLILDEADRMLDMGFIDPVVHIASLTPATRQTLLFSATLKGSVMKLSNQLLNNPVSVEIAPPPLEKAQITENFQLAHDLAHKHELLDEILSSPDMNQAIVFTATKRAADEIAERLSQDGHITEALHGDMRQRQRDRTIRYLRSGKLKILVATDVAARGIDILSITHVINFDLPNNAEDYVHRIGRTGRAGATGFAFSFATKKDRYILNEIEKLTGQSIPIFKGVSSGKPAYGAPSRNGSKRPANSSFFNKKDSWKKKAPNRY
jgi:superfamily II DNA/RNA helicase